MGAGELARAARSLESVQGNVAGQTMAIQSLSMSTQSAVLNVGAQMNALSSQLASLNSSIARLSGGMAMSSMPPPPPMMAMGGGGGFQVPNLAPMGAAMGRAGMGMMSGLGTIGTGLGYMGGSMMAPIMGNVPVTRTPYGGEMAGNASMYQAAVLASGLGVGRGTMRNMNYDRATQAGRERMGDIFGAGMLATAGGAAHLGAGLMGDFVGSRMIMPMLGYSGGGLAGGIAGSLAGGAVMAPVTMALQQTMEQTAQINKFGQQYGRNAHRAGLGRPGRDDRASFGRTGLDVAISDMTLSAQDVTDITAGMFNNDLTRGVRSTSEANDRLRELSRSVKTMARTLGGSYGEMMQTAGELQSIGMTINPENTRRAVFGAGSVSGMTGQQGMAAGMNLAQPFVGMGLGAQGFGIGLMSANAGQYAVQSGALSGNTLAAVGGREGAQGLMSRATANFLQGPGGMAMLAGGMTGGGGFGMGNVAGRGMQGILGRGGAMASGNNLLQLALNPQALMEQAAQEPTAIMSQMASQAMDIGRQVAPKGASQRDVLKIGLRALTGMEGPELDALAKTIEAQPEANRKFMREQASQASSAVTSDIVEQRSITGRLGRGMQRLTQPLAGLGSDIMTRTGNEAEAVGSWLEKKVYGTETVQGMGRATMADVKDLRSELVKRGAFGSSKVTGRRQPTRESMTAIENSFLDNVAMDPRKTEKLARIKAELADTSDPERKRELVEEAMSLFPEYVKNAQPGSTLEARNTAIEKVLGRELGNNVSAIRSGEGNASSVITEEMKRKDEEDVNFIKHKLRDTGMGEDKIKKIIASDKVSDYFSAKDPAARREIIKTLSDEEKRVIGAISGDKERLGRMTSKMRRESSQASLAAGGEALSGAMGLAGIEGGGLLSGSGAGGVIEGLGKLNLGEDEISRLRETGQVGEGLLTSLGLRTGKVDAGMREKMKSIMSPSEVLAIGDELSPEELEEIRGGQVAVDIRGEMKVDENQKVTQNQAQMLMTVTQDSKKLAEYTKQLGDIVERIKSKG